MDQYKEISTMRAEIEKVLQEQRLEKIRRDFEKQKYEDERRYNHERWLEEQKREILAAKLRNQANGGNSRGMTRAYSQPDLNGHNNAPRSAAPITAYPQPQTSRYNDPGTRNSEIPAFMNANVRTQNLNHRQQYQMPQSARNRDVVNIQPPGTGFDQDGIPDTVVRDFGEENDHRVYDVKKGLGIHFDFVTNLERKYRDVRLVYGVFNYTKVIVSNREVGIMQSEPDPANMARNRVFFDKKHILKNIKPHAGHNLIMEFQVKRTDTEPGDVRYASIGWTIMNLFDSNYELNIGQFRVPLYLTPTQPDLDVRDIPRLKKVDRAEFWFRIAVPKDPLAKMKILPDTHPGNYSVPRIHTEVLDKEARWGNQDEVDKAQEQDRANIKQKVEEDKLQHEAYECSGVNVFVHYIKNFEPTGLLRIRCSMYEGPKLLRDNQGKPCQWSSRVVHPEEAIIANQDNMEKLLKMGVYIYSETKYGKKDVVVPINDDKSWLRDFYTMLWDNHMKNEMYLIVELMVKENPYKGGTFRNLYAADPETVIQEYTTQGATIIKWNNFDGTIRYGSYELPLFEAPLDRANPKNNKELPYIVKVTVGQPVNQPENVPTDLFDGRNKPESLFRKPEDFKDETNFPKRNPNADNPDPFIPNEKNQIVNELFNNDIVILYIDWARFLPENVSFSRVVLTWYTSNGNEVARQIVAPANMTKSTGQNPFFGLREEFSIKTHPNMDPTMIAVFKVETFDRSNGEQRIVGFSMFPFFMDKNVKSPVRNAKEKKYVLHNGCYQLPMYWQKPNLTPPLVIEELTKVEKLPCSTLLIRVEKAPKDIRGNPISIRDVKEGKAYELGVVSVPPKYPQGAYNTTYCSIGLTEAEILKEKSMRADPLMMKAANAAKELLGNRDKMSAPELRVFLDNAFSNLTAYKDQKMLNYNFFSQYIPRIGMRFAVEMLFNTEPKQLYLAIASVNPPASIYQKYPKFEKAILFTDIDFTSPWSAQRFTEMLFTLKNMPSNPKTTFIIDIKAITFLKKGVTHIDNYGWACFPMFEDLETDDDPDTVELYVNSGVYMLPLFEGQVVGDFVNTVAKQPKPYAYLMEQVRKDVPPIRIRDNAGVIVKWVDNQREGHFKEALDVNRVDLRYVPQELKTAYVFDQNTINGLKRAPQISKLLPKGKKPQQMKEELLNILRAEYNID